MRLKEMGPDKIPFRPGLTDLYSNIEEWLIDELGIETGRKSSHRKVKKQT